MKASLVCGIEAEPRNPIHKLGYLELLGCRLSQAALKATGITYGHALAWGLGYILVDV